MITAKVKCVISDKDAPWHMSVDGKPEGRFSLISEAKAYCREAGYVFEIVHMREATLVAGKRGRPPVDFKPCSECGEQVHAKGLCKRHYLTMWKADMGGRELKRLAKEKYRQQKRARMGYAGVGI